MISMEVDLRQALAELDLDERIETVRSQPERTAHSVAGRVCRLRKMSSPILAASIRHSNTTKMFVYNSLQELLVVYHLTIPTIILGNTMDSSGPLEAPEHAEHQGRNRAWDRSYTTHRCP